MAYDAATLPDVSALTVAILGGTGDQGRGLAYRLASAGQAVLIGSRSAPRAEQAAAELAALPGVVGGPGAERLGGGDNADVSQRADLVIIAVPWEGHAATVAALRQPLAGKVVVDCV
ncbi:MAG TPA: NAD(P)-binding domain-containing protein, partial [Pilimelia sp.]|nr:NAD(P)-binding domain-containing protein [Pilimelia sp.]